MATLKFSFQINLTFDDFSSFSLSLQLLDSENHFWTTIVMLSADKVGDSLRSAFEKQDFYEAHQIYKSINFRYVWDRWNYVIFRLYCMIVAECLTLIVV